MNSIVTGIGKSGGLSPLRVFLASLLFASLAACGGDPSAIKERDYDRGKAGSQLVSFLGGTKAATSFGRNWSLMSYTRNPAF